MNTKFIAEVSSNHNQSFDRCKKFVELASKIGCYAVKFQLFKIEELFASEILSKSKLHRERKDWELPLNYLEPIYKICKQNNIKFACTPFYLNAVDELNPYVDFFKIASYELLWDDLLIKCANTGKHIIISTGMATTKEIKHAVDVLKENGCKNPEILHCVSAYPTPIEDCNLSAIKTIRDLTNCQVGWSDHTVNKNVLYRAIHKWKSSSIEFHLDIEGEGEEFKSGHCWLPKDIQNIIESSEIIQKIDGLGEKIPRSSELNDRVWRADPEDGLRPLKQIRKSFMNN